MNSKTKIEWTDATWNPVTGCAKVSQGCKHCYAERMWPRISAAVATQTHRRKGSIYEGRKFTDVMCHPERLDQPLRWKKPRRIFVNSMSDLFHESVPFEFIASVFAIMSATTRHQYQVLTKRPERMLEFFNWVLDGKDIRDFSCDERIVDNWPKYIEWEKCGYDNCGPVFPYENVWLGVSVEDQETADERIPLLLQTPAAVRWLSMEPLIGPIDLERIGGDHFGWGRIDVLNGIYYLRANATDGGSEWETVKLNSIDWIVVGGESGPKARPMHPDWVRSLQDQCKTADVPFFFKQWGEWKPDKAGSPTGRGKAYVYIDGTVRRSYSDVAQRVTFVGKKAAGRELDGKTYSEYPA